MVNPLTPSADEARRYVTQEEGRVPPNTPFNLDIPQKVEKEKLKKDKEKDKNSKDNLKKPFT